MDWLTGGKQGEAKRLIGQLLDSAKRDQSARDLIELGPDAVAMLLEALQTKDPATFDEITNVLLNDPEREVKRQVIAAMGELKDASVLSALQSIMANRADREFHTLAKDAIAKLT